MEWPKYPLLRVAIMFMAGLFCANYFSLSSLSFLYPLISILVIYSGLSFYDRSKSLYSTYKSGLILVGIFLFGGTCYHIKKNEVASAKIEITTNEIFIQGIITEEPILRTRYRTYLQVKAFGSAYNQMIKNHSKLVVYFSNEDEKAGKYLPGTEILVKGSVVDIPKSTNPAAFDYTSFLYFRGMSQQIYVRPNKHIVISENELNPFLSAALKMRILGLRVIDKYVENVEYKAVAQAILLGYKHQMTDDMYQSFTDSGAVHVLAVSGLHVGIVLLIFVLLFRKIKSKSTTYKLLKTISLVFIVWLYVFITGASPAVIRAGTMFSIFLIGNVWFATANIYNTLSVAAIFMLVFDPFLLFQASFQFSFLSLSSIVFFQPYVKKLYSPANTVLQWSWNLINVAIAAQILVFPITIYYFHKFPTYFMISGLVAIPFVTLLLYIGLIMLFFEYVFPFGNIFIVPIFNFLLKYFIESIRFIKDLPFSSIRNMWITDFALLLIYFTIVLLMIYLVKRNIKFFYSALVVSVLWIVHNNHISLDQKKQNLLFLYDVNQGLQLDYFSGHHCFSYKSDKIDLKNESFVSANNRIKHGIDTLIYINQYESLSSNKLTKSRNIIQLTDKINLLIGDNRRVFDNSIDLPNVTYLVISSDLKQKPSELNFSFKPDTIIIAKSYQNHFIQSWREYAENANIPYLDMNEVGFIKINLN